MMYKMIADRYLLVSSLGEGGMADVYLAKDTILNRDVAIKILRGELSQDPVALLRFQREANAASKLNHPNVVDVYDVGEFEGRHYIVMEYVRGKTLKQLISQRGALHKEEVIDIMIQLTSAVLQAHEHNIVHRDIKPQNVLVKDDGTVKITDFGIAVAHDSIQLTQNDAVLGSAHYLAPETTRGETPTNQIDLYALGIVFYELLVGKVPFHGENPLQIAMKHIQEEMPSVRDFNPTIPQTIENIITKATVKNKKYRYQSAKSLLLDLQHCLDEQYQDVEKLEFKSESNPTLNLPPVKGMKEIKSGEKTKMSTTKKIIGSFVIIFGIVAIVGVLYLTGAFNGGRTIVVPDLKDLNKNEAIARLEEVGFDTKRVNVKYELSDTFEAEQVISITPKAGTSSKSATTFDMVVSKGKYYVVEDYRQLKFDDVVADLTKKNKNITVIKEEKATSDTKSGYIIEQKGLTIGEKLDPSETHEITFVVTVSPSATITGIIGRDINEVIKEFGDKGIVAIAYPMSTSELSEIEIANLSHNTVINCEPGIGSKYIQEGENTVKLYYYQ